MRSHQISRKTRKWNLQIQKSANSQSYDGRAASREYSQKLRSGASSGVRAQQQSKKRNHRGSYKDGKNQELPVKRLKVLPEKREETKSMNSTIVFGATYADSGHKEKDAEPTVKKEP